MMMPPGWTSCNQGARLRVEFCAGKADVEELSYLLFEREWLRRFR